MGTVGKLITEEEEKLIARVVRAHKTKEGAAGLAAEFRTTFTTELEELRRGGLQKRLV